MWVKMWWGVHLNKCFVLVFIMKYYSQFVGQNKLEMLKKYGFVSVWIIPKST